MGGIFRFFGALIFFALIAGVVTWSWVLLSARAPGPLAAPTLMQIETGIGAQGIAARLVQTGIITDKNRFLAAMILRGAWGDLKAGEYEIPAAASMNAVIDQLAKGDVYQRRLTIPEGLTVTEIIAIINAAPGLTGEITTIPDEGRLLPETYQYTWGMTRQSMITRMQAAMTTLVTPLWEGRAPEFPLASIDQVLTMASIIEKETGMVGERAKVASVFFNRLQTGMKLQTDPTVIYAITKGAGPLGRELLIKDLEQTDSPYNTYKYPGLPPGPIANPGAASIRAVFAPDQTDYFYFVADGTGGHIFARNLDDHNRNVANWRRIERDQKTAAPTTADVP